MKRVGRVFSSLLLLALLAPLGLAQDAAGPQRGGRNYDVSKETTVTGTVQEVKLVPGRRSGGTHLMLKTDAGVVDVHVGPTWYLEQQQFRFAAGEAVKVTGSKLGEAVIAREITRDGETLVLRDAAGIPKWRGRRGK